MDVKCSNFFETKVQGINLFSNQFFFIWVGSFQNIYIESELAFSIWNCELKVKWQKWRLKITLTIWLSNTKPKETWVKWHSIKLYNIMLERPSWGLQLCSLKLLNHHMEKLWTCKVARIVCFLRNLGSKYGYWRVGFP